MIPKTIHYCWFGPKPLPKSVISCIKSWNAQLPGYELKLWNENNSPMDIPFVSEAYKARKYAFVSDYVRFWALYNYGGVYLDTDMFVIRSFDGFLENECFFGWETPEKEIISCGVIGSTRENPFIQLILDSYNRVKFDLKNKDSIIVTRHISRCYEKYTGKHQIRLYDFDFFYPFPYEEKENVRNYMKFKTKQTHAIHLWSISWGSSKDKFIERLLYHLKNIIWFKFGKVFSS